MRKKRHYSGCRLCKPYKAFPKHKKLMNKKELIALAVHKAVHEYLGAYKLLAKN